MKLPVLYLFCCLLLWTCTPREDIAEKPLSAQEQRLVAVAQGWQLDGHYINGSKQPNPPLIQWQFEAAPSLGRRSLVVDGNALQKSTWELKDEIFVLYYPVNVNFGGKNSLRFEVERIENQDLILRALEKASLYGKLDLEVDDLIRWLPAPQP